MNFDPQKHHRRSIRLKEYDYTQPGGYYITIVTYQREHLFGEIEHGEMTLNKFGLAAKQQWEKLPKRFPNIELGASIFMPNHMHGVIRIFDDRTGTADDFENKDMDSSRRAPTADDSKNKDMDSSRRAPTADDFENKDMDSSRRAPTANDSKNKDTDSSRRAPTADDSENKDMDSFRRAPTEAFQKPVPGSIPTIVRSYKSAVSYRINLMRGTDGVPVWQRNYYEHVIRNHEDWDRIERYIEANPSNWLKDKENL